MTFRVAAFYKFSSLPNYGELQKPLLVRLSALHVKGSVLLANEGINGTIAALPESLALALTAIAEITGISGIESKISKTVNMPFKRMKVRLKKEIVTIGNVRANPNDVVGKYVAPEDWNKLISDPDVVLIDTRNAYEVRIGTFKGAVNPHTESFSEFPGFVREHLKASKSKKIAMFCTGGIRCEKASSFMKHEGFENVYHLKGGILKYLECIAPEKSLWQGACFVFDERVAVEHGLQVSDHTICHGCLEPVTPEEGAMQGFEEGVSCPRCVNHLSPDQLASNRERQKQFLLAQKNGQNHIGPRH
jgi:UPF0176 protein